MDAAARQGDRGPGMISFVLPVFNERGNLQELHRRLVEVMDRQGRDYEMLFVDDGSTDGSFEILQELHRIDDRVRVIRLRRNFGKAAAYSAGFDKARGGTVITLDTDLQDDPEDLPLFLSKLDEGFDIVCGWKHEGKGGLEKTLPSKFFNRVVRILTKIPLHDFNCPFKAYRAEVLSHIEVYGELHRYIPVLASAKGFSLTEVKIRNHPRGYGKTKYGYRRYLRGLLDLLTVIFITRFAKRPMHLLGLSGVVACAVGGGTLAFFVLAHFLHVAGIFTDDSWILHDRPALSLGVLLIMVGIQFFTIGLLGELFVTRFSGRGDDRGYSVRDILDH